MDPELKEQEWEKIRWQLGQIIKSWSKVERVVKDNYVAYKVSKNSTEVIFAYLFDNLIVLSAMKEEEKSAIEENFETEVIEIPDFIDQTQKSICLSLTKYRFTEILPFIQPVYRQIILKI